MRRYGRLLATSRRCTRRRRAIPRWSHVGSSAFVTRLWQECFTQLELGRDSLFTATDLDRVEQLVRRYLEGRDVLFQQRIAAGRIRDGHGDLQADDIFVLPDGPRILDCIEFSDELRWGDVLSDVAFLAMDLERLGAPTLAGRLLTWHREFSADTWPESLAHHYIAYRAAVRAKVTSIRHQQGEPHAAALARSLLGLALDHLERGRVRLVLVGGLPGTGKSTLSAALADQLPVVVLRTDELRAGRAQPDSAYGEGRYTATAVVANYRSLLDHARQLLRSGESVVLDGSWSRAEFRALAADLATTTASDLVELCCTAPSSITTSRITERARRGDDLSEATPAIAADDGRGVRSLARCSSRRHERLARRRRCGRCYAPWELPNHHRRTGRMGQAAMTDRPEKQVAEATEASRADDQ